MSMSAFLSGWSPSPYFAHEAWFELSRIMKVHEQDNAEAEEVKGIRLISSYGKVRDVFADGTYYDVHTGKAHTLDKDWMTWVL